MGMNPIRVIEEAVNAKAVVYAIEEMIAQVDSLCGTGSVHEATAANGHIGDPTSSVVCKVDELKLKLDQAKTVMARKYDAVAAALDTVEDDEMKMLLYYRYMLGCKWNEVAVRLGPGHSADALKMRYSRYARDVRLQEAIGA